MRRARYARRVPTLRHQAWIRSAAVRNTHANLLAKWPLQSLNFSASVFLYKVAICSDTLSISDCNSVTIPSKRCLLSLQQYSVYDCSLFGQFPLELSCDRGIPETMPAALLPNRVASSP